MKIHENYIKRCIQLAGNGLGNTYPNPMVGSVIIHNNKIIGEGWHHKAGEAHAEVNAINAVKDKSLLKEATIYVSLEPCSHFGKTPPCSDLIIDRGIKKVVIGTVDPFAKVAGRGIKKLMDAGCEVIVGILEEKCRDLNKRFFTFHQQKRPFIILKWAQSEDGFLAPLSKEQREPVWITTPDSRQLVHKWRAEEQAILVGTNTAIEDNPKLNIRLWHGSNPTRIVLDRRLRIPQHSALFDESTRTIVLTEKKPNSSRTPLAGNHSANTAGAENLIFEEINFEKEIAAQICEVLYRYKIQSVIIEGGRQTLQTFIDNALWDEARVFTGKLQLKRGIKAPEFFGKLLSEKTIKNDKLKLYNND